MKVQIWGFRCERCGHEWAPREPERSGQLPTVCPKCKSPYWYRPRQDSIRPEHRVTCTWRVKELNGKSIEYRVLRNGKPDDGVGYLSVIDLDDKTMQISIFPADDSSEFKLNQIEADYIKTHPGKYRFSCFSRA